MDLTFLQPMFLWAGLAMALPLMLHLLKQRQRERVPFPTLRFLRLAQQRSSRRIKIEHLLLWLLRTALIAALVFAFTMPVLRSSHGGDWLGRARRDIAIILDVSFSMGAEDGGVKAWNQIKEAATAEIKALDEGDRVCIFLAGNPARALFEKPTADRDAVLAAIKDLTWGHESSRIDEAVAMATAILHDSKAREREIHIFTDGQAFPWHGFKAGGALQADAGIPCFVLLAGTQTANAWIAEAALEPPRPLAGQTTVLTVRPGRSGAAGETALTLEAGGAAPITRTITAGTGTVSFTIPPQPAGSTLLRLRMPPDALPSDDGLALLIPVRERLPVLCIGPVTSTQYLGFALDPPGRGANIARIEPAALATLDLSAYETIFLADALPLPPAAVKPLGQFVRYGGVLAIFAGDRANKEAYASLADLLPAVPVDIAARPADDGPQRLRPAVADPIVSGLSQGVGSAPVLGIRRQLRFAALPPEAAVLLFSGDNQPFLLARNVGRGRTLLCAVSTERRWSTLPLSPVFLPLIHQIVRHGLGPGGRPAASLPQRQVPISELVQDWRPGDRIVTPSGKTIDPRLVRTAGGEILELDDATEPGLWQRQRGVSNEAAFSIRTDPAESDLSPVNAEDLPKLTSLTRLKVARNAADLDRLIQEHRRGQPFAEPLLWLVLVLAGAEWWVANLVHHRRQVKNAIVRGQ
jgi:hypothetical protein